MLRILGRPTSINVRKVLWTCAALNLPYELDADPAPADLLRHNPNAMMPVLADGEFVLWESNAICRYLATRERSPLLPSDAAARALVEQWMDWQATEFNNSWRYAFMALVRRSPQHTDAASIEAGIKQWNRHAMMVEHALSRSGAYIAGNDFSLADIVIGLSLERWRQAPMTRPACPAITDYMARLAQQAGFSQHCANGAP